MKMISHLNSVIFAVFLLFLTADGRKTQAHVEGVNVNTSSSSTTSSVDSTSSCITHSNDVKGLIVLIDEFPQLAGVKFPSINKDPCSPHKLTWISCSNDPIRRVTALYLGSRNLHGPIPDFSSMDALQTIDLHGNYLSGPIPGFFTSFPKLKHLNLAKNSVSNTKKLRFRSLAVAAPRPPSYYCPRYPCPAPPAPVYRFYRPPPPPASSSYGFPQPDHPSRFGKGKRSKLPKILGITIPPSLLTAIGGVCCCARSHKRKREEAEAKAKDDAAAADQLAAPAGHPPYNFHPL
ncbi:hypothetical protein ABFX02_14G252100 [Erythranthe guttata]